MGKSYLTVASEWHDEHSMAFLKRVGCINATQCALLKRVSVPDSLGELWSFAIQFSSLEKLVEIVNNLLAVLDIAITRKH
jgi:hypothetical protein